MILKNKLEKNPLIPPVSLRDRILNSPSLYLAACFFLPLLITWIIFIIRGVYPFGDKSVLVLDLNGQYVYFFEAMRNILRGEGSAFYSWYRALGGEFSGIYAYYVASPFSLITVLFPDGSITEALLAMTLLKAGTMGLIFGIYLHKSRPSRPLNVIMFSTMYALTSYAVVQAHNTMWMDALIYLPLIALGIEYIINRGKFVLYTVSLALCFIANFYIGFMVAIFSALYFFYYYVSKYEMKDFTRFFFAFYKWLIFSVVAACIASIIIIPTYFSLEFGKNTFSNPSFTFKEKFDFLEIFTQMMPNSYDTVRPDGLPFIYCGVLSLLLLPVYFTTGKIKAREKIMSGLMIAVLALSFAGSTIDLFWHGMQRPNWLNYRYSFVFCFMILIFAYEAFRYLRPSSYRTILGSGAVIGVVSVIVQKLINTETGEYEWLYNKPSEGYESGTIFTVWFWLIMTGVLVALLWGVCKKRTRAASVVLCAVVMCELFVNGIYDMFKLHEDVYYSTRPSYVDFMTRWGGITDYIQQQDISLYRMEKTVHRKVNDNMALSIRGVSNSTSTLNASVIKLLNKLGYASKSHWSKYVGGNPVTDSLLGIKYVLSNKESIGTDYTQFYSTPDPTSTDVTDPDLLYAFINEYALPILYGVSDELLAYDWDDVKKYNASGVQISTGEYSAPDILNSVVSAMLGREIKVFIPVSNPVVSTDGVREAYADGHKKYALEGDSTSGYVQFDFTAEYSGDIYVHFPSKYPQDALLKVRDVDPQSEGSSSFISKGSYMTNDTHSIFNLGEYEQGHDISVQLVLKSDTEYYYRNQDYIFYFDREAFREAFEELAESPLFITHFTDTHIKGTIDVQPGDELIFTSIPYDEGWSIKVDGEKLDLKKYGTVTVDGELRELSSDGMFKLNGQKYKLSSSGVLTFDGKELTRDDGGDYYLNKTLASVDEQGRAVLSNGAVVELIAPATAIINGVTVTANNDANMSLESLLCFKVTPGEHTIELKYTPRGFVVGCFLCAGGIAILVVYAITENKKRRTRRERIISALYRPGSTYRTYYERLNEGESVEPAVYEQTTADAPPTTDEPPTADAPPTGECGDAVGTEENEGNAE